MDKKNLGFQTQLVFHAKFQKQQLKMLKSLFKLFATLGKESLTETRVRLYKQMKTKTFQFIPPMLQAIQYDVFY